MSDEIEITDNKLLQVWKFELPITDTVRLEDVPLIMPLHVGEQSGKLMLWGKVVPSQPRMLQKFYVRSTGHPLGAECWYKDHIGTVQMQNGLVWHVFG